MKKLFVAICLMLPSFVYAQWDYKIGGDLGYTVDNFVNIDASISSGLWYYGFSAQVNTSSGTKGKSYDKIINWENDLDGVSDAGKFYSGSYGFDLGYYFMENFCLGGGIGYAPHRLFRNFHDNTEILSNSGWYHVTKSDGGRIDAKAFVHYYFKRGLLGRFYLRGQYSLIGNVGVSLGYQL